MPAISHVKSNTVADFTGTVTVFNSQGSSATMAATNLVRPSDWNSAHNQYITISGNTGGDSSAATATNVVLAGTGAATVALSTAANAATVWISAPSDFPMSEYEPISGSAVLTNSTLGQGSLYFVPFYLADEVYASRVNFFVSVATTMSAANNTGSCGMTLSAALYTRRADSIERISQLWSGSFGLSATQSSNTALVMTNVVGISNSTAVSTVQTSIEATNASTYMQNSVAGYRVWAIPINTTLAPGRYWMVVAGSSAAAAGTMSMAASVGQQTVAGASQIAYQRVGTSSSASNVQGGLAAWNGAGYYSATSGAFPASVFIHSDSVIRSTGNALTLPYFNFSGYTTASSIL